ncbi:MAG: DUF2335 domain-containing protein [Thiobacillaceae bacterium]|nr:DUF2335 domain-containing protein [Thiobacillaceae bacterium]MDW8323646.1 DUF2335 domain-containing protein [Burkholderiales bacterium]
MKKPPSPDDHPEQPPEAPTTTHWLGPLPPPEALQKFDAIVERGAERIFRMAEAEQQHRLQNERDALASNIEAARAEMAAARTGLWLGALVSMMSIAAAVWTVHLGAHWIVPTALVGVPLMSAVRAIILRK